MRDEATDSARRSWRASTSSAPTTGPAAFTSRSATSASATA